MRLHLTGPQIRALDTLLRLDELPTTLDRHERKALTGARQRIEAALAEEPPHQLTQDMHRLEDLLLGVLDRGLLNTMHRRLRDLLATVELWCAAEELPRPVRSSVLSVEQLADGGWAARVLDLLDVHGIEVVLPGESVPVTTRK